MDAYDKRSFSNARNISHLTNYRPKLLDTAFVEKGEAINIIPGELGILINRRIIGLNRDRGRPLPSKRALRSFISSPGMNM